MQQTLVCVCPLFQHPTLPPSLLCSNFAAEVDVVLGPQPPRRHAGVDGLAKPGDDAMIVVACELVLEALVARRKISRSDEGRYGRAERESRRNKGQADYFG